MLPGYNTRILSKETIFKQYLVHHKNVFYMSHVMVSTYNLIFKEDKYKNAFLKVFQKSQNCILIDSFLSFCREN